MSAALEVEVGDRDAWLAERRSGIGASEAAAALGLSPFETPLQLYLRKAGLLADAEETDAMYWGSAMEPILFDRYERETGRRVVERQRFLRSGPHPHLFATLDGVRDDGLPVECKTISGWKARDLGDEFSDEVPDHWLCQAYMQMWLAGAGAVDFAVVVWGNTPRFRRFTVERTPRVEQALAAILPRLHEFWGRVVRREPPAADASADARLVPLLYPDPDGTTRLGDTAVEVADRLESAREAAKAAQATADRARAELLLALGDAREGVLPDGRRVRRYDQSFPEATVARKAYTSTTIKVLKARER